MPDSGDVHRSSDPNGTVDTFKEMFCIRVMWLVPFLLLLTAIVLLVVAGFDEGFQPCPNFNSVSYTCSDGKTDRYGTKSPTCDTRVEFGIFCGNTMQPRVTTCCRVPCQQNFTTYFDAKGKPADCFSQSFKDEPVAIAGCVLLALSLASLLLVCTVCKVIPGFLANIRFVVSGRRCAVDSNRVSQELPEHVRAKEEA
jgi:hypothetical protein